MNSKNLNVFKIEEKHGFCVKTMRFKGNKLISGAPDFRLLINDIPSQNSFFTYIKYIVYLSILVLVIGYFLKKYR